MTDNKNENISILSPTPIKEVTKSVEGEVLMTFAQAMEVVCLDKKIHKLEWKDRGFYGVLHNELLMLHKPDGKLYPWKLSRGDLGGTDYVIV